MKTLMVALGDHNKTMRSALQKCSSSFRWFNWKAEKDPDCKLQNILKYYTPDFTFMQLQSPDALTIESIKSIPGTVVSWTGDVRDPIPNFYHRIARVVDCSLFSNMPDVQEFSNLGFPTMFFDIAFEETVYKPDGPAITPPTPTVFFGNHYNGRFPLSDLRFKMVRRYRHISTYGFNWKGKEVSCLMEKPEQEAAIYRGCKIAINLSHFCRERYTSDRLYRAMACGAFCLSHHYPGIEQDFSPGIHLVTWTDLEDLNRKIEYYLSEDGSLVREQIAKAGCEHVWANHRWIHRFKGLLNRLDVPYD